MSVIGLCLLLFLSGCVASENDCECKFLKRLFQLETEVSDMREELKEGSDHSSMDGSTYIRWGRRTCPENGTELIYTGYSAGSMYTHTGAASNRLCMPKDPTWGHFNTGTASGAFVAGGEFEFHSSGGYKFFGKNLYDREPYCSMCMSNRRRIVMIPGRSQCYDGWTMEYSGYLTAGYHKDAAASEYLCVDRHPEFPDPMATKGQDGTKFHFVDVVCGSLPCPPYEAGREVTCVVCTM